jgi:hypothetical protein
MESYYMQNTMIPNPNGGSSFQNVEHSKCVRNIALDLVLTLVTFGLFNFWVQYQQIQTVNYLLNEKRYSFIKWAFLTLITFGLYHIYHEYKKSADIAQCLGNPNSIEPIISVILTVMGMFWIADAIQQISINRYFGSLGV